jgi:hypothetical protein
MINVTDDQCNYSQTVIQLSYLSKKPSGLTNLRSKLPVISSRFNAAVAILGFGSLFSPFSAAQAPESGGSDSQWIAEQIFANECNSKVDCLTSWNQGEDFPSLGLGHFIWYQKDQQEIYQETFPELVSFYHDQGIRTPNWLTELPDLDSPWADREQFYAGFDGERLRELRDFLHQTLSIQARFIIQRQQQALGKMLDYAPPEQRQDLASLYREIAVAVPPLGRYALVDYVNFKGEGIAASERYQGQGWGLLQVLQAMLETPGDGPVLERFSDAAAAVLRRRVANAPVERNEQRWLAGWLNRVQTYRPETWN